MAANKHAALLQLRQRFIREKNFGLNHLQEGIDKILPDAASSEAQSWKAHVNALSDAGYEINRTYRGLMYPPSSEIETAQALQLDGAAKRAAIRSQRKLEASGVMPPDGEVGPVRPSKSIFARRIEQKAKDAKGKNGRRPDFLALECVIEGTDEVKHRNQTVSRDKCTWCTGCDKQTKGYDPTRVQNHAHMCQELQANWPELWALVDEERGGKSVSVALETGDTSLTLPFANLRGPRWLISIQRQAKIDLLLFKLIICCALPFALLLSNPFFIEFVFRP
ncbi:hypothetical protein B0H13DRAFT_2345082 [Mycena leptocephala]|nr:hypothetical protein B0H13DRAFT_2345082 [Mycena leptocephala]